MNNYNFIINHKISYNNENSIINDVIDYDELIKTVTTIRNFENIFWKYLNKGRLIIYNYYGISSDNNISQDYIKNINKYLTRISKGIRKISTCYSYNFDIFYIFRLYNLKRYNKYLILGPNACSAESIFYYNKSSKITYIDTKIQLIDKKINYEINDDIKKKINDDIIKKVKNINIDTLDNFKKYECIIFSIMSKYIKKIEEYLDYNTMKNIELQNIKDFEKAYELLDNIDINGTLILYTSTIITKEVLLIIENISVCFANTFIYKAFSSTYKILQWVVITFENFKLKKKKKTTNSEDFILSIKDFYNENMKIYKTIIDNYNFLFHVRNNNILFEHIMDNNILYSYEIYKYLQFPPINFNNLQLKIIKSKLNSLIDINQNLLNFDIIKKNDFIINYNYIKLTEIEDMHNGLNLLNILINNNKNIIDNEVNIFYSLLLKILNRDKYWISLYEILKITNIINNNNNIFILSKNYVSLLDAIQFYCNNNNLKIKYNHTDINILDSDEIKKYKEKCKNSELIIVNCNMKKYNNKVLAYYAQVLFVLNNTKKNGNAIIKFKLFFNKKIIFYIVYLLSLSFNKIYFYKSSINLYNKFYIICRNKNDNKINLELLFNVLINKNDDVDLSENYNMNYLNDFIFNYKILINNFTNIIYSTLYFSNYWNILNENNKNIINKFILNKVKDWKLKFLNNNTISYKSLIKNKDIFINFSYNFLNIDIKSFFTTNELETFINIRQNINKKKASNKSFDNIKNLLKNIKINNNIFVDIGCGSGILTNSIEKEYKFNKTYCFETNNYINPHFNKIDLNIIKNSTINLPDNCADLILCNFTLHHVKELEKMISEITRILKPDGYLIIQEHNNINNKQKELLDYMHIINYLLLVDCKNEDFEILYFRFINEYYANYTSKNTLNSMLKNYKIINEITINAGFIKNYLQLLSIN